jgi:hypothetical protein
MKSSDPFRITNVRSQTMEIILSCLVAITAIAALHMLEHLGEGDLI